YKFMPTNSKFDYLELKSHNFYPIEFRVIRFKISDDTYETIITNLNENKFSAEKIKELYHMRWGIETSFRELKYARLD
ncbi:transposase, partial [Clostridium neonatale]